MPGLSEMLWQKNTSQTEQLAGMMSKDAFERAVNDVLFIAAEVCKHRAAIKVGQYPQYLVPQSIREAHYLEALECAKDIEILAALSSL